MFHDTVPIKYMLYAEIIVHDAVSTRSRLVYSQTREHRVRIWTENNDIRITWLKLDQTEEIVHAIFAYMSKMHKSMSHKTSCFRLQYTGLVSLLVFYECKNRTDIQFILCHVCSIPLLWTFTGKWAVATFIMLCRLTVFSGSHLCFSLAVKN